MSPARRILRPVRDRTLGPVLGSVVGVRTSYPGVALTFDDGPDPYVTPALLELLAAHQARATFFVLLTRARAHPEVLARVVAGGHEVALHGLDHTRLTTMSARAALDHVRAGRDELDRLVAAPVRLFRPPHGAQTPRIHRGVRTLGLTTVLWNGTSADWRDMPEPERWTLISQACRPGAIVLGHDGRADERDNAEPVPPLELDKVQLWSRILAHLTDTGLRGVSVSQLLTTGSPLRSVSFAE